MNKSTIVDMISHQPKEIQLKTKITNKQKKNKINFFVDETRMNI